MAANVLRFSDYAPRPPTWPRQPGDDDTVVILPVVCIERIFITHTDQVSPAELEQIQKALDARHRRTMGRGNADAHHDQS